MIASSTSEGLTSIGGTRWYDLKDSVTGAVRRVFLWIPSGDIPKNGWPSLTMTDGNALIGTAVDAMRAQASYPSDTNLRHGVLIAVGYPSDDAYDPVRRSWDLGPPPGASYPPFWPDTPDVKTGGGAEMARFLLEDLRGFLEPRVKLDRSKQGLFGHSFGGLFTLWLMFNQPDAFSHWIAASPSITWEDNFLLAHRDAFDPGERQLTLHLSAGEWEGTHLAPFQEGAKDTTERLKQKGKERTLEAAMEMAKHLQKLPGMKVRYETYVGETHMSVLPIAINRALHTVFALRNF